MTTPEQAERVHPSGLGVTCPVCGGDEGTMRGEEWVNCDNCDGFGYVTTGSPRTRIAVHRPDDPSILLSEEAESSELSSDGRMHGAS